MTNGENRMISDAELDRLLASASRPEPSGDFMQRITHRIAAEAVSKGTSNVVAFRPRKQQPAAPARSLRWPFVAAMAASLAIGLWVGGNNSLSNLLDQTTETAQLDAGNGFAPSGLDELGNAEADNLS